MVERFRDKPQVTSADQTGGDFDDVRRQIEEHRKHDGSKGYLARAIGAAYGKDEESLDKLEDLATQMEAAKKSGDEQKLALMKQQVGERLEADRQALATQDEISIYGSGFLKTAGLFARGKLGLAGTLAIYALDQMNPADSVKTQMADLALGGAKGGLMKGAFALMGEKPVGIAAKGVGLGVTSRALETGLTRSTYVDRATGETSLGRGLTDTVRGTLNPVALAADVVVFGAAHGMLRGANSATMGLIDRSPLVSTMLTGTTFGLSGGATGEIMRQKAAHEDFDLAKIVKRSLIQGALDTFAAAGGGLQARSAARAAELTPASLSSRVDGLGGEASKRLVEPDGAPERLNRAQVVPEHLERAEAQLDKAKPAYDPEKPTVLVDCDETLVRTIESEMVMDSLPGAVKLTVGEESYETAVRPSTRPFLSELSDLQIVLLTTGGSGFQTKVLEATGLRSFFTHVVGSDNAATFVPPKRWVLVDDMRPTMDGLGTKMAWLGAHQEQIGKEAHAQVLAERYMQVEMWAGQPDKNPLTNLVGEIRRRLS